MFVYDVGDGPAVVVNPRDRRVAAGSGRYHEGCLSVPDLRLGRRPAEARCTWSGQDLDGEELDIEADELLARCFQHEVDHLDGVLLLERLDPDQRKEAMRMLRRRTLAGAGLAGGDAKPGELRHRRSGAGPPRLPRHARGRGPDLGALVGAGHEVVLVVSAPRPPPRAAWRRTTPDAGEASRRSSARDPRERAAVADVVDSERRARRRRRLRPAHPLPEVLERLPMVNVHFSLLPRWRGAAPVERAILAGDATTGVCLMALEEGLDTGPVYAAPR